MNSLLIVYKQNLCAPRTKIRAARLMRSKEVLDYEQRKGTRGASSTDQLVPMTETRIEEV